MGRLSNRVALITGAASGMGAETARSMAREGASVICCDIDMDNLGRVVAEIHAAGGEAMAVELDVSSEAAWADVAEVVEDRFGRLDVLVNNAGTGMPEPTENISLDEFRRVMAVNLESVLISFQQLRPLLEASGESNPGGASVVNVASLAAIMAPPNHVTYNTSKAGVRHMTKSLAVEYGPRNIRFNTVHPGLIKTPMLDKFYDELEQSGDSEIAAMAEAAEVWRTQTPLRRLGLPSDIANAILYLASDESAYVTGLDLIVGGGVDLQ